MSCKERKSWTHTRFWHLVTLVTWRLTTGLWLDGDWTLVLALDPLTPWRLTGVPTKVFRFDDVFLQ